ncbi:hypothetical protein PO909_008558 [Leuciscus waleckii]
MQAFSVDEACLEFGPANSHVILRPRPGYVPKVPTTPFRDQVVNLQAVPSEEADPVLALHCPVRALRAYVDRTRCFRTSDHLFVCYGGKLKGKALSKQRLSHWIVVAIALAYQQQETPVPVLKVGDDIESNLRRFERLTRTWQWPREEWSCRLVPLLTGKALEAYLAMDEDLADDYDHLKDALLQKFNITAETYRQRFRAAMVPEGESPTETYHCL